MGNCASVLCRSTVQQMIDDAIASSGGGGGGGTDARLDALEAADVSLDSRLDTLEAGSPAQTFDVRAYGAVINGTTDDTGAIQAAISAASSAGGGEVYMPAGSYALTSAVITLPSNVGLRGAGAGRTILLQKYWPNSVSGFSVNGNALIMATGTLGTSLTCSAVSANATTITGISSTASLSAGQYVLLASEDAYWSGFSTRYKGEILRVLSVDSGTQITVTGVVRDTYTTVRTVTPLNMVANVSLTDFTIRNTDPATTHATGMIWLNRVRNVRVENVELIGSDYAGVRITQAHNGRITNLTCYDFTDVPGNSQLGYGVLAELATEALTVDACRFVKVRHGFTTGGYTPTLGGAPRNVVISNCVAQDCTETAFDTHQTGGEVLFVGNTVNGTRSAGFSSRSLGARFIGNSVSYAQTGFVVFGQSGGIGHATQIIGNVARHIWGDYGVRIYDADRVTIADNTIDSTDSAGVYVSDNATNLTITDNRFYNVGIGGGSAKAGVQFAVSTTGSGHRIERNIFYDGVATTGDAYSGPGNMDYAIRNLSTTVTGCWFVNNTVVGSVVALVSDAAAVGANVDFGNYSLDKTMPAVPASAWHTSAARVESSPRIAANTNLTFTSGTMYLAYFTAPVGLTVTSLIAVAGSNTSATGISLARFGLYSVASNGNLTLVQGTTSDTALFAAANASVVNTKAITSSLLVAGNRYAIGVLVLASGGTIAVRGTSSVAGLTALTPAMGHALTGQTDLPASVTAGSLATTGNLLWAAAA